MNKKLKMYFSVTVFLLFILIIWGYFVSSLNLLG